MATILVADDDPDIIDLIDFKLTSVGHRVVLARDGAQALMAIAEHAVDLVVLDSMMPRMTGPQVLSALRADPVTRVLPVIMISAHATSDAIANGMGLGATAYLPKPFSPRELAARVESLLERCPTG